MGLAPNTIVFLAGLQQVFKVKACKRHNCFGKSKNYFFGHTILHCFTFVATM